MAETNERPSSTMNSKIHSDSGYGSNKSNSQSQRSSGSSKSQRSSLSSGSGNNFSSHPNAPISNANCQPQTTSQASSAPSSNSGKRQGKKKNKEDRKRSLSEKNETRLYDEQQGKVASMEKAGASQLSQMDQSMPSTPQSCLLSPQSNNDSKKALQVAALTHALSCKKKIQDSNIETEISDDSGDRPKSSWEKYLPDELKESSSGSNDDGFATVVSLGDGIVVYITSAITRVLGYPKDALLGRSFVDFVDPKDRLAFVSHLTCGINFPIVGQNSLLQNQGSTVQFEPFYCRLRQYRGLNVGSGINEKANGYHPFKMTMQLKQVDSTFSCAVTQPSKKSIGGGEGTESETLKFDAAKALLNVTTSVGQNSIYLVIGAVKLKSAYQSSDEIQTNALVKLIDARVEFLIGQHRILQGPENPTVFMQPDEIDGKMLKTADGNIADGKEIADEIRKMLTETIARKASDPLRQQSLRFRKNLAALVVESLLEQMGKSENSEKSGSECSSFSVMERDSVMLGCLSPHTVENSGSNQSSSTPPSYNELNYRENIDRFFQSQPKTERSEESGENSSKMETQNQFLDSDGKGDGSGNDIDNVEYESGSNIRNCSGSNESGNYKLDEEERQNGHFGSNTTLTQRLLTEHNEKMERQMAQKHRESRSKNCMTPAGSHKDSLGRHRFPCVLAIAKSYDTSSEVMKFSKLQKEKRCPHKCDGPHGLKRAGNFSWDDDSQNVAKQPHLDCDSDMKSSSPNKSVLANRRNDLDAGNSVWPPMSATPGIPSNPSYSSVGYCDSSTKVSSMMGNIPVCSSLPNSSVFGNADNLGKLHPQQSLWGCLLPGQHHQYLSPQVQLMPAGVVYHPISPYGQQSHFLMPLGTMIHPYLNAASPNGCSSVGPTPTLERPMFPCSLAASCCMPNVSGTPCNPYSSLLLPTPIALPQHPIPLNKRFGSMKIASPHNPKAVNRKEIGRDENVVSCSEGLFSGYVCSVVVLEDFFKEFHVQRSDESMTMSSGFTKDSKDYMDQDNFTSSEHSVEGIVEKVKMRSKEPSWLEKVLLTPELSLRYKIPLRELSDVLQRDLAALKLIGKQPHLVESQLNMLYEELEDHGDGLAETNFYADEGISNSSSGGEEQQSETGILEETAHPKKRKSKRTMNIHQYTRVAIIHEENSPFPPDNLFSKTAPGNKITASTSTGINVA